MIVFQITGGRSLFSRMVCRRRSISSHIQTEIILLKYITFILLKCVNTRSLSEKQREVRSQGSHSESDNVDS